MLCKNGFKRERMMNTFVFFVAIVFLHQVCAEDCPEILLRYSETPSYCLPKNKACKIMHTYETKEEKDLILELHNLHRSSIAIGKTDNPSAADMLEMEWDDELASVAQRYAEQCLYEHDCNDCRRLRAFGVGQNLAKQTSGFNILPPPPDWKVAVDAWFDEIKFFQPSDICPYTPPNKYGHFTELIWAKSFRVGCGYVMYKAGTTIFGKGYERLYVCNYGPGGNAYGDCVYEQGEPCSKCPENTCCGSSCGSQKTYKGLCKVNENKAPKYPPPKPNLFYCGFQNETDCEISSITGYQRWTIFNTISDNYLEIILNGGENSTVMFKHAVKPETNALCVTVIYRKGPNIAGTEDDSTASLTAYSPLVSSPIIQQLPGISESLRQVFSSFKWSLGINFEIQIRLSFSVPPEKPAHFFNVKSILMTEGMCQL